LRPTSGSAQIAGYDLASDGLLARGLVSYVPDEPYLYEKLTAREFLRLIGELYAMEPEVLKERIEKVVSLFELSEFLDHLIEGYSHGMKQRTVIAAALLHEPRVMVIDEPMVGLDPRSVRTVKDTLKDLSRNKKMTVFMSTHTLSMAEEAADRIGILNNGKLITVGTLPEIKEYFHSATGQAKERLEDIFLHLTAND
jgi:ABC-2 type transport system ATP-binding protein